MDSLQSNKLAGITARGPRSLEQCRVLVPVDFSLESFDVLRVAIASVSPGATIHALHVLGDPRSEAAYIRQALVPDGREERAATLLEQQLRQAEIGPVEVVVRTGAAGEVIVQVADELGCDLIVIPSEKRSLFRRMLSESVTECLVRRAPCPVLVLSRRECSANSSGHRQAARGVGIGSR